MESFDAVDYRIQYISFSSDNEFMCLWVSLIGLGL